MTLFNRNVYPCRCVMQATFMMMFIGAWTSLAHAQTEDASIEAATTAPYSLFQYSTLTGLGNTMFAGRVPVANSTGTIKYYDVTVQFNVDSFGNLTLASGNTKIALSQTLLVSGFQPGRYVGPSTIDNGQMIITVSNLGVTKGGATEWSLLTASGAYLYTYPSSAAWYVGPIANNPEIGRIQKAGLSSATQAAWSFGVGGPDNGSTQDGGAWYCSTPLLGFSQTGNQLTIVSFTDDSCADHPEPVGQITYVLKP